MEILSKVKRILPFGLKHRLKLLLLKYFIGKSTSGIEEQDVKRPCKLSGLNVIGFTSSATGIGESARAFAMAAQAAGIKTRVISITESPVFSLPTLSKEALEGELYDVNVFHINAAIVEHAVPLMTELFEGRYNIGYWAWELSQFPEKWDKAFDYFNEIWVPSNFVREAVEARSPISVKTIHHAVVRPEFEIFDRNHFHIREDHFVVLMMFDVGSVIERKNPFAAIRAFKRAFADTPNVTLAVKIRNSNINPESVNQLKEALDGFSSVFIDQTLTRDEIWSLIDCCDTYISLHRSEGFGLIIAEAMLLGKPVIVTDYSGNMDFCNENNAFLVNHSTTTIEKNHSVYEAGYEWAEPSAKTGAKHLRFIYDNPEKAKAIAIEGQKHILHTMNYDSIGKQYINFFSKR